MSTYILVIIIKVYRLLLPPTHNHYQNIYACISFILSYLYLQERISDSHVLEMHFDYTLLTKNI